MNATEFFEFLLPQKEFLQMTFFFIILVMMMFTIGTTHKYANATHWEEKWNGTTPDEHGNHFDIDHGSVMDISNAVATAPEKLAEIMPGMLLVVGLLGTFLGLGLALNHASHILDQADVLSTAGAASSMQDLMSLLQGLGTKFKASTWGIAGFLLLKVWSSLARFEEKRLTWVIRKVKAELERRKTVSQKISEIKQQALFSKIEGAANLISESFSKQVGDLRNHNQILHENAANLVSKSFESQISDLKRKNENLHQQSADLISKSFSDKINDLKKHNEILHKDAASFVSNSFASQIQDLKKHNESLNHFFTRAISEGFSNQTNDLKANAESLQSRSEHFFDKNAQFFKEELNGINLATQASSVAISGFVGSTKEIIQDMANASLTMAEGADKVGEAGKNLISAIDAFSAQFTEVLNDIRTDLGCAINNMSEQATQTLEQGSRELGHATLEISKSLEKLAGDVTVTMTNVKDSIDKSLKIQTDGALLFRRSSDTLNENVTATTGLVEKLGDDIRSGLEAVSESGRRMTSIGKSLEAIVPQLSDLPFALKPLEGLTDHNQNVLNEAKGIREHLSRLNADSKYEKTILSVEKLLTDIVAQLALTAQNQDLLKEIKKIHNQFVEMKSDLKMEKNFLSIEQELKSIVAQLNRLYDLQHDCQVLQHKEKQSEGGLK